MTRVTVFCVGIVLCFAALGCESAVVGADCRAPYTRCGRYCVDLATDTMNCGACGSACGVGCFASACIMGDAAVAPDSGRRDAGRDAGHDAAIDASDSATDAFTAIDAGLDASQTDAGARCGIGELLCGGSCVRPTDATHCGDCATICSGTDVCAWGSCAADCGTRMACGTSCVDLTSDSHHCGDCAIDCGTQICALSTCAAPPDGHLVVIGHDYETRRIEMSTVLANAVLLRGRPSLRIVAFQGSATAIGIAGANAAIAEAAGARTYTITSAGSPSAVPLALENADALLLYGQTNASNAALRSLGQDWDASLHDFLARGGVIVLLDAPSLINAGTYQILDAAGLFTATSTSELVTPRLIAATGRESDPVIAGITFPYSGERHTVRLTSADPNVIVTTGSAAVVFHRILDN